MRIKGEKLGWAIIHTLLFTSMLFGEVGLAEIENEYKALFVAIIYLAITVFFGWRIIENMKEAFEFW